MSFHPWHPDDAERERISREILWRVEGLLQHIDLKELHPEALERALTQLELELGPETHVVRTGDRHRPTRSPRSRALLDDIRTGLYALAGLALSAFFGSLATGELTLNIGVCLMLIVMAGLFGGLILRHITSTDLGDEG